jgi:predicted AAA+ superfamily ATPase
VEDRQILGFLAESLVASNLFKMKEQQLFNIFYDPTENGVDFLIETVNHIIPIEVGLGKKDKKQISRAISRYNSPYGIIISNTTAKIRKEDNIIYIPLISFS